MSKSYLTLFILNIRIWNGYLMSLTLMKSLDLLIKNIHPLRIGAMQGGGLLCSEFGPITMGERNSEMRIPKPKQRPWIVKSDKQIWGRPEDQRIYKSARWRRVREIVLSENPICKCGSLATIVDHRVPISKGGAIWDGDNLQSMCEQCHNKKSAKESNQ